MPYCRMFPTPAGQHSPQHGPMDCCRRPELTSGEGCLVTGMTPAGDGRRGNGISQPHLRSIPVLDIRDAFALATSHDRRIKSEQGRWLWISWMRIPVENPSLACRRLPGSFLCRDRRRQAWRRRSGARPRRTGRTETPLDQRIRGAAWSARPPVRLPGPEWMPGFKNRIIARIGAGEHDHRSRWNRREQEITEHLSQREGRHLVNIEVKASASGSGADFKHLKRFAKDGPGRSRECTGIVLHLGREMLTFGSRTFAHPVSSLWNSVDL